MSLQIAFENGLNNLACALRAVALFSAIGIPPSQRKGETKIECPEGSPSRLWSRVRNEPAGHERAPILAILKFAEKTPGVIGLFTQV